ncbi:MAG: hypothetical protein KBG28_03910 [Kofleriaceae bacterium]|jgi:hypothetical protein|nr:hypothetical protein [Kofleriaceae bacterium]MBP6836238.1 hypothetical protein [Kofleriaceae bacterium]MBP9203084.1 hypothetical protein [Kofleriaceae bacterium]
MNHLPVPAVLTVVATAFLAASPAAIAAPDDFIGSYDVKYEEAMNNCSNVGMSLARGTLTLDRKKAKVEVNLDSLPTMMGPPPKAGRLRASSKQGPTTIAGLDGQFSLAGRVEAGAVQFVLVAEYFANKKPLCQQSWNVSGVKRAR